MIEDNTDELKEKFLIALQGFHLAPENLLVEALEDGSTHLAIRASDGDRFFSSPLYQALFEIAFADVRGLSKSAAKLFVPKYLYLSLVDALNDAGINARWEGDVLGNPASREGGALARSGSLIIEKRPFELNAEFQPHSFANELGTTIDDMRREKGLPPLAGWERE